MTLSRGIDVSHHQGRIEWPRITREHGLTWAACKATEGQTFRDSEFPRNWPGMKAAGLVRMAYHFGRPGTDATAQARFFLGVVRPLKGDVLCLDLEKSDNRSQTQCNAWAKEFAAAVRKGAPGCTLVAYLGGYASNGTGKGLSDHFDYWWYPRYATMQPVRTWPGSFAPRLSGNTTGWKAPHIWQWAASLVTSEGQVDANISPLTAAQLRDGPHRTTPLEDDMPTANEIASALLRAQLTNSHDGTKASLAAWLVYGNEKAGFARDNSAAAIKAVDDLRANLNTTVSKVVADTVRAAIADGTINVQITVNGGQQ